MIDRSWIGKSFPAHTARVEAGQLAFFAKATHMSSEVYSDKSAAQQAGYSDIPAPLTFGFSLNLATPDPFARYTAMGIELGHILHGAQRFVYHAPMVAGDELTLTTRIADIQTKKGGALEIVEEETTAVNQRGEDVATLFATIVVRNPGVSK